MSPGGAECREEGRPRPAGQRSLRRSRSFPHRDAASGRQLRERQWRQGTAGGYRESSSPRDGCQWLLEPCLRPRQPYQEPCTGTWETGPFDSDLAADFVDELEGLTHQQVIDVPERAFQRVTDSGERVDGADGAEAVAAGALVASTLPGGSIVIDPDDGPREPLPQLPAYLRASVRPALDRVLRDGSEMAIGWVDSADAERSAFLGYPAKADFQTFCCRAKGPHRAAHCRSRMVLPSVMRPSRVMARASAKGSSKTSMSSPSSSSPPPVPVRSAGV